MPSTDEVQAADEVKPADGVPSADGIQGADEIQRADGVQSGDGVQAVDGVPSADGVQGAARSPAADPVPLTPDDVARWERKGRGLAVFRCPATFCLLEIESRPGTAVLYDTEEVPGIPGEPDRLVLKLTSGRASHLNGLINLVVLPAFRRFIPLYLLTAWDLRDLDTGSVETPGKAGIEDAMLPLLREQLRSILACTCAVFPAPEALIRSRKPWLTPVEATMHEGLTRAGLSHGLHVRAGAGFVDALVEGSHGAVAVEIDGRAFDHRDLTGWDRVLAESTGVRDVVRFSGSEVMGDPDACIDRVRSVLSGRGNGTVGRTPDPEPGLAGEQARCLEPRAGVVLTLAPAGSGKTRVLTRRVVEAVRGGVKPSRILCVVFNKAASEVMSERIHTDAGLPDVHIRTLHSLGYEICRQAPASPYAGFGVVTEQSLPGGLTALFRRVLGKDFARHFPDVPHPFPEHLVVACEEAASLHRRTLIPIGGDERCREIEGFDRRQVRRVCTEVERLMNEKALMTFDEQLFRAVEILLADPRARSLYQHRFDSVMVDEVQDLTPVQFLMLRLLSLPLNNLFAVGDDDQMINTFTGADPENIRSFRRWYPGAAVHTLGANYRCRPDIVTRSASVISHNVNRFEKPIRPVQAPTGRAGDTIRVCTCPSPEAETDAVVRTLRRWRKRGYAYGDMAVLVRVQSIAAPLQSALKEAGLPFDPLDESALFQSHPGRTLGAYFDVIAHDEQADLLSYAVSLSFPSRQLSNAQLREAAALGHRFFEQPDRLPGDVTGRLDEYRSCIEALRAVYGSPGVAPVDFLDSLMDRSGLAAYYRRRDETRRQRAAASDGESIDLIRQMAAGYPAADSFVDAYIRSMASEAGVGEDAAENRVHQAEAPGLPSPEEDRITVTTIHRSKGDEYKGVILFHVVEDILPHRRMTGTDEDVEEERRVFYVALTRAEEKLCITTQRKRPSRFLAEMKPAGAENRLKRLRDRLSYRSISGRLRRLLP